MGFGSLVTGLAIYKPEQLNWLTWLCGGYTMARAEHFALTIGYVLFFCIHIVQVIIAGWNNFRSVITGFEVVKTSKRATKLKFYEARKNKPGSIQGLDQQIRRRTFVSFSVFASLSSLAYGGWRWLSNSPKEARGITGGAKEPFRKALNNLNWHSEGYLAQRIWQKTYPKSMAAKSVCKN